MESFRALAVNIRPIAIVLVMIAGLSQDVSNHIEIAACGVELKWYGLVDTRYAVA